MRHNVKGRKFSRTASHRKAMFSNLSAQLFEHKQIKTTLAKAKELRKYAEKMITLGKKGDLNSLRQALKFLKHKEVVFRLFNDISPNYKERNGGYTRVFKLGTRKGDAAEVAVIQLVEFDSEVQTSDNKTVKTKAEETKAKETKAEETKAKETKVEEAKVEEAKVEEAKVEEAKVEETKVEEAKVEEAKVEPVKEKKNDSAEEK
ncbi:MAG: 50S ribosomal protein L17 [Candidatus Delongbacteria bacterium]|jgi:large subunit ribosomal protein L17|nr:50S ribosomal protein L17 [Candidatus Delongbacteria bacterium]